MGHLNRRTRRLPQRISRKGQRSRARGRRTAHTAHPAAIPGRIGSRQGDRTGIFAREYRLNVFLPETSTSLRDALRIPASQITDESIYRDRRRLSRRSLLRLPRWPAAPRPSLPPPPKVNVTPEQAGSGLPDDQLLTRYQDVTSYNNFYEFGTGKGQSVLPRARR